MRRRERTLSTSIDISHYPVPENNYPTLFDTLANLFCCMCCYRQPEEIDSSDSDDAICSNSDSDDTSD